MRGTPEYQLKKVSVAVLIYYFYHSYCVTLGVRSENPFESLSALLAAISIVSALLSGEYLKVVIVLLNYKANKYVKKAAALCKSISR